MEEDEEEIERELEDRIAGLGPLSEEDLLRELEDENEIGGYKYGEDDLSLSFGKKGYYPY